MPVGDWERETLNGLEEMGVAELAERCRQEMAKSRRKQPADDRYCFELFRRAIVQQDQQAWEAVFHQYRRLVYSWIGASHPEAEDLVNEVFTRFLQRITLDEFQRRFHHLGGVLGYLQVCAKNLVINRWRCQEREKKILAILGDTRPIIRSPESEALENIARQELAAHINTRLRDERERLVFYLSYELGLKPKEIRERYPDKFESPKDVSRIKERVLERLRRDPWLLKLWGED